MIVPALVAPSTPLTLWYAKPAEKWVEALPIGNGRFGAMVFGGVEKDRLQLNDITVWSGKEDPKADRQDAYKSLPELRKLIREGKYAEAHRFAERNFNSDAPYEGSYQTMGDLTFDYGAPKGEVSDYRRELDLRTAISTVSYRAGGVTYRRETFASAPHEALVQRFTASRKGMVSFSFGLQRAEGVTTRFEGPDLLVMTGDTGSVKFEVRARLLLKGGTMELTEQGLVTVSGADDATLLVTSATNYGGGSLDACRAKMAIASSKSYASLRSAHIAAHRKRFGRVELNLGAGREDVPTDERLKTYRPNQDLGLETLLYQFGRYLLISSAGPDSPLPPNLQGIWGDGLNMPWNADYHININLQMNYWPAETANLREAHAPLVRLVKGLQEPGAKTAKAYFGPDTPGWVAGYTTNAWRWTTMGSNLPWGIWFGGSGWICSPLWEHYAFNRDTNYLREVYPILKGAAEFYLATLVEDAEGNLVPSPSTSPENGFTTDQGVYSQITEGTGMNRAIIWDLFDNVVTASNVLGTDKEFAAKVKAARDRVRPPQIGKAGQLMEWNGDWDLNSNDPHHRHISHLYPLMPGHQITVPKTPRLAAAVRKSLELRGDDGTGWALAWKANCWARLHDGDHAHRLIERQLRFTEVGDTVMAGGGGTYANMFDAHPPFQIDGNFGVTAAINEMLVQSHEQFAPDQYVIELLPALPTAWATGSISGVRARGGLEVSLEWESGKLKTATLKNVTRKTVRTKVRLGKETVDLTLMGGESRKFNQTLA